MAKPSILFLLIFCLVGWGQIEKVKEMMIEPNRALILGKVEPADHTQITFEALTQQATIRIFNIAGQLVKKQEVGGQYSWDWDVKNMDGEDLARGVYIWVVTNPAGEKRAGKIAIIK